MTDVWCEDKYCIHNLIGKCSLDSIGLTMYDRMLSCKQYDSKQSSTNYDIYEDDGYYPHGDR